jgi:hypothetical protein
MGYLNPQAEVFSTAFPERSTISYKEALLARALEVV